MASISKIDSKYQKFKGRFCEALVIHKLKENNYEIIKNNYKCIYGEVDIIISKGNLVIFVEVKAWDIYDESEIYRVISSAKLRRLELCAQQFLIEIASDTVAHTRKYVRIDVILVKLSCHRLVHYKGV